jgi:hypothetical protein
MFKPIYRSWYTKKKKTQLILGIRSSRYEDIEDRVLVRNWVKDTIIMERLKSWNYEEYLIKRHD